MIVCCEYENDDNELIKDVQHDEYMRSVGRIFQAARSALSKADAILGTNLLVVEKARSIDRFDHRVLQSSHDIMAAAFRYFHDDGGQLGLFEKAGTQRSSYRQKWTAWLSDQLVELVEYPQFVRSVVECVLFSNTEMGYMAERRVGNVLLSHYSAGDWASEDGFLKIYQPTRA